MTPTALTFSSPGPEATLHLRPLPPLPSLSQGEVLLRTLSAPINPIDLLVLQDRYPVKPKSAIDNHAIPGYDGLFQVLNSNYPPLLAGDYVIPRNHGFGTWRTHVLTSGTEVVKVPKMDLIVGAILKMGACPAWLLLEDMPSAGPLKEGDWIILNGGTSVVAQLLVQFARLRGVKSASVIRDRPDFEEVKARLEALGATIVVSESQLQEGASILEGKNIVLGLDCVFGKSGESILNLLAPMGTYINYGMLSGPSSTMTITSEMIVFRALTLKAFRLSKRLASRTEEEVDSLLAKLADLFITGEVEAPQVEIVKWGTEEDAVTLEGRLKDAVDKSRQNAVGGRKAVFLFH